VRYPGLIPSYNQTVALSSAQLFSGTQVAFGLPEAIVDHLAIKGVSMNSRINGTEYIEVADNVHLHICDWGEGTTVVFIPGWPFGHELFEYQFNRLPQLGCRCIGISMRGFGKSSKPWGEYSYDIFADDLHSVLHSLGLNHVTLVGFAMGGAIALRYMARHGGDLIDNLVLCGAAAPSFTSRPDFPFGSEPGLVQNFISLCYTDRAKLNADFISRYFKDSSAVTPQFLDWLQTLGMEASPYATAACLAVLRDSDLREDMKSVHVPTVLFHGVHDLICPFELAATMTAPSEAMPALAMAMAPGADAVAGGIHDARLVRFENSGHALFYEERERFNAELKDFIDKKDGQKERFFGPSAR
jgi:pimeloyl-ACP methyl ester carboxylesterase